MFHVAQRGYEMGVRVTVPKRRRRHVYGDQFWTAPVPDGYAGYFTDRTGTDRFASSGDAGVLAQLVTRVRSAMVTTTRGIPHRLGETIRREQERLAQRR